MFFATYDAKELAALASVLKIKGRSKLKKQELFDACYEVVAAAHAEALEENDTRDIVHTVGAWLPQTHPEGCECRPCGQGMQMDVTYDALPLSINGPRLPRKLKKSLRKAGLI